MSQFITSTTPLRTFADHEGSVSAVAVFPDKRRMITGSWETLRLWDLETGIVLKKMEGHSAWVQALAVSRDGQIIASDDKNGEFIGWHGETGGSLTKPIKAHTYGIYSIDFSPDGTVLATGSWDKTIKFWCTKTWQMQGEPIHCREDVVVNCVRYSPSGELLAIATFNIQIYNPGTRERVAFFGHYSQSLAWTPDGTRLLSGGNKRDPTIREWDTLTWEQVGHPWKGHTDRINAIAIHPAGTLVASASYDNHVRLWSLLSGQTIAIFQHSSGPRCVTFSVDGKRILSGGDDKKISEWELPKHIIVPKVLAITTARDACVTGDLDTAEDLLTQEIDTDDNPHTSYAHRSFVMARKHDWDHALRDALKSISIQPSLIGYISKGIALCGNGNIRHARAAFDVASMFTDQDPDTNHFLLLIKVIALFNADQHEEALLLVKELSAACPNVDPLGCCVVETYLRVQLGTKALDGSHYDEAADHFTAAVNSGAFSSKGIHEIFGELIMLFGWDLKSLCLTTHQKRCQTFLSAGKLDKALEAHQHMMDVIDETAKASCLDWSNEFKEQCSALAAHDDRILGAEIPGQDQDGYDTEPDFFHGMHQRSQISRPRPQQRPGRLKRLRLAMTRTRHSAPPPAPVPAPAPTSAPPTTTPPASAPTTFRAHLRHLYTRPPRHATPPVVEVPFAKGKERNAAAGPSYLKDPDIVPLEYQEQDTDQPDPDAQQQQQQQAVAVHIDPGEHGGGKSCVCC